MKKEPKKLLKGYTFIDLFSGLGGFHLALASLGAKCVYSDDWNKQVNDVYKNNFGYMPHGDITKISANDIPNCDIVCAGFPCQAFSISGKELGFKDTRGTLFFDVARIVRAKKPKVVLMENVKNLVHHDHGRTIRVIKNTMIESGYSFHYKVLNAAHYGIPQNRQRVYMVCFRRDLNVGDFEYPRPISLKKHVKDILEPSSKVPKDLYVNRPDIVMNGKPDNKIRDSVIRLGKVNKGGQGERIYSTKGVAITLSAYGGGAFSKTGGYLVNGKPRKLTPRECARLMGFPDSYKIDKNYNQAYKQFGNSVVVDVLQYVCEQIAKSLHGNRRKGDIKCYEQTSLNLG